jgi:hypothetical protein
VENCGSSRQAAGDNIIQRMHIACWITEATHIRSEYVILIVFPLQQRLHERASMLRYTYFACLVFSETHLPVRPIYEMILLTVGIQLPPSIDIILAQFEGNRCT